MKKTRHSEEYETVLMHINAHKVNTRRRGEIRAKEKCEEIAVENSQNILENITHP